MAGRGPGEEEFSRRETEAAGNAASLDQLAPALLGKSEETQVTQCGERSPAGGAVVVGDLIGAQAVVLVNPISEIGGRLGAPPFERPEAVKFA